MFHSDHVSVWIIIVVAIFYAVKSYIYYEVAGLTLVGILDAAKEASGYPFSFRHKAPYKPAPWAMKVDYIAPKTRQARFQILLLRGRK